MFSFVVLFKKNGINKTNNNGNYNNNNNLILPKTFSFIKSNLKFKLDFFFTIPKKL